MEPQTIKNDFVLALGNFAIDAQGSRTLIPPPPPQTKKLPSPPPTPTAEQTSPPPTPPPQEETSPTTAAPPKRNIFSFLDSPSFQDSPVAPPGPYPTDIWGGSESTDDGYYNNGAGDDNIGFPFPIPIPTPTYYGFLEMATKPESSKTLRKLLFQGIYVAETFNEVFPSMFRLMSDESGRPVFEILLQFCTKPDLYKILEKFVLERESFAFTALREAGSRAIQAFVKKLKNTGLEIIFTSLLAAEEFSYVFMTHKIASHVIRQCFDVLGDEPNRILYECVLRLFHPLAMDPVGCITVNAAIDSVRGRERYNLLTAVVENASQLSYDPSGNYIVQHCLKLKSRVVTEGICVALRGEFVELAQKKGGSFVVEKCLESEFGRVLVLSEIFKDDKILLMLARDHHGNYPVQTALRATRIHDKDTYEKLVKVLEPRHGNLIKNAISNKRRTREEPGNDQKLLMMFKSMGL